MVINSCFINMTAFEKLSHNQKIRAALHKNVFSLCLETCHSLGLEITRPATVIVAELVCRKIALYGLDLEAFAKHAKRSVINSEDVKLLARRNNSLKEHLNEMCKSTPATKRRKTTLPVVNTDTIKKDKDETQIKKPKIEKDESAPGPSKPAEKIIHDNTIDLTLDL